MLTDSISIDLRSADFNVNGIPHVKSLVERSDKLWPDQYPAKFIPVKERSLGRRLHYQAENIEEYDHGFCLESVCRELVL